VKDQIDESIEMCERFGLQPRITSLPNGLSYVRFNDSDDKVIGPENTSCAFSFDSAGKFQLIEIEFD
jgi:hypothetical protein